MALSDDQKAMLRLLAQREEGYEDIAALLGLSTGEVRARVKEALAELESAEAPPQAPPVVPPSEPPRPAAPVPEPEPPAPSPPAQAPEPKASPAAAKPAGRRVRLPKDRRRLIEIAGGALVAILLVLFATGAVDLGGGDSDSDSNPPTETISQSNDNVTQAILAPPDGGDAIGQAVFGRVGKGPILQLQAKGLDPSPAGQSYTVWLYRSPKLALRVGSVKVEKSGGIAAQFPIPVELLSYVAGGAFDQISVSLTDDNAYKAEIAQAKREKRLPGYSGTTVLRGEIAGPLIQK